MAAISTEQALQIPQHLRRQGSHDGTDSAGGEHGRQSNPDDKRFLSDDPVSLQRQSIPQQVKPVAVEEFKSQLGQDQAFIKETLRNKLSEYQLSPYTQLSVSKDAFGQLEVKGQVLQTTLEHITNDLNKSAAFKQAFDRVSQQQPTLNYVDNVVKLSKAYGVSNNLFNSLISEEAEYNGLNDIAHRYQALKASAPITADSTGLEGQRFEFSLNV
ncbi:MAG: hypothetical protein R3183_02045 [Oleiphilaceae bacterium]|nr:hypothetical protein [Oleiphilaceae bacterium]